MEEISWEETMKAFWIMVGMASVNVQQGTDLSNPINKIEKLLKEKVKEEWKK